jgi:RNA polymerase sigma-B factor
MTSSLISAAPGHTEAATLFHRWQQDGDAAAREEIFRRFQPLARKLASRYVNAQEPLEDLVQVAYLGLLGAIDRFDADRGLAFSSFAVPTVLGELKRHFRDTGWAVHVPRGAQEMSLRVDRAITKLTADTGRPPTVDAVAQYLEVGVDEVLVGMEAGGAHYSGSLEAPFGSDGEDDVQSLGDVLGQPDPGFRFSELTTSLQTAVGRLPKLERLALGLRLDDDMKQTDIARRLGCSQMHVSRLLRRAAERLREEIDTELD